MLTPAEHVARVTVFQEAFTKDGFNYIANQSIHSLDKVEFYKVLDHIGYNIYRALRLRRKYQENPTILPTYMEQFRKADYMTAGLLNAFSIEVIQEQNSHAYDMIRRFLKIDSF